MNGWLTTHTYFSSNLSSFVANYALRNRRNGMCGRNGVWKANQTKMAYWSFTINGGLLCCCWKEGTAIFLLFFFSFVCFPMIRFFFSFLCNLEIKIKDFPLLLRRQEQCRRHHPLLLHWHLPATFPSRHHHCHRCVCPTIGRPTSRNSA